MRFFLVTLSFLIIHLSVSAQGRPAQANCSIDGQVLDSLSKSPLEYVAVGLFNVADSSLTGEIYTDEKGNFVLSNIAPGTYYMRFQVMDYRTKQIRGISVSNEKPLRKLGTVSLAPELAQSDSLDEFVLVGEKDQLQIGLDKKVYNVGEDISVQGGNVNDVLNNVPSVEIDQDGKISLRGDGNVTILINGRPSSLSGGNGKSQLDGIPASSIERIEIVTNPSAKYDPDGTSGIINIVLKKNIRQGLNGQVNVSAATGNAYNGAVSLNMRNTKFNLFGNYSYDYKEGFRISENDQRQSYGDSVVYFRQRRRADDLRTSNTLNLGMDIYLKDRNTLSWNLAGNLGERTTNGDQTNFRYLSENDTLGFWNRHSEDPRQNKNADLGLTYHWDFKEDKGSIDWNAYQSLGQGEDQGYYDQSFVLPADSAATSQRLFANDKNNITTLSMDVVRILKGKWRTESGLKLIHRDQDVSTRSDARDASGNYQSDTLANFDYSYRERIYSAYGIIAGTYKKFSFQGGLRFEQSFQEPNLVSSNEAYSNSYFNVFPSAHVRYKPFKTGEFSLGYSKRINRASSDNLNPFTSYADPYNLRRGNPALQPEYIHSFDLGYEISGKKVSLTASAYQRYSFDVIQRVKIFYEDGTAAGTFANVDNSESTGGELVLQYRPVPIWKNTLSGNGNYIRYKDDNPLANWNRQGFTWSLKYATSVELMKKTLVLQLNGRYNAPSISPQGKMLPRGSVEFSADKSFKEGKWGVGIRVSDIFNTQGFEFEVDQASISQHSWNKWQTQRVYLNLRYKFGRTDITERKKKSEDPSGGGGGFDF